MEITFRHITLTGTIILIALVGLLLTACSTDRLTPTYEGTARNTSSTPAVGPTRVATSYSAVGSPLPNAMPSTSSATHPTPISTSNSKPTPLGAIPDSQIAELEKRGIHVAYLYCDSSCRAQVTPDVPLETFVMAVGIPDKVGSSVDSPVDFVVFLIYGKKGMIAHARRPYAGDYVNMTPTMRVTTVFFYKARSLEELETETHTPLQSVQDWSGFGPVGRLP